MSISTGLASVNSRICRWTSVSRGDVRSSRSIAPLLLIASLCIVAGAVDVRAAHSGTLGGQGGDPPDYFIAAQCARDLEQVRALGRAGETDSDQLRGLPNRARIGIGILLVLLRVAGKAELVGQVPNLLEPLHRVVEILIGRDEARRERPDQVGRQS